jgi:BetI-type transcriptional repressor, C-terminal
VIAALVVRVGELFRIDNVAHHGKRARPPTLHSHLESAWRSFASEPHLFVVLQELTLRAQRDPQVRAAFRTLHVEWAAMIETLVREGVERGELRDDVDPGAAARIVTSYVMGASLQLGINAQAFAAEALTAELERWLAG